MSEYASLTKRKLTAAVELLDYTKRTKRIKSNPIPISTLALQSLLPPIAPIPTIPASYDPTSLPSLIERISTFKLSTYHAPASLSPLIVACHGWKNIGPVRNRLECITCKSSMIISGSLVGKIGEKMIESYLGRVKGGGHLRGCPWTVGGCRLSIYSVLAKRESRAKVMEEFMERGESFDGDIIVKNIVKESNLKELGEKIGKWAKLKEKSEIIKEEYLILALLGWSMIRSKTNSDNNTLHCHLCTRTILSSYYSKKDSKPFDSISQHQLFCPYIHTQSEPGESLSGWKKTLEMIIGNNLTTSRSELSLLSIGSDGKYNTKELLLRVRDLLHGSKKMRTSS